MHANQLLEDAGAAEVGGDHQNHHYEVDLELGRVHGGLREHHARSGEAVVERVGL